MKEIYLDVYFTKPYWNGVAWRAYVSDTMPTTLGKDAVIYKASILLPKEIIDLQELSVESLETIEPNSN